MVKLLASLSKKMIEYQHLLLILLSVFLISTSGWILMGRGIRANASIWDLLHVYLGLLAAFFSVTFLLSNVRQGKWRQYFPWLAGDFAQVSADIKGLFKGKIPAAGGKGLFSLIEGIGLLLLFVVALTGTIWFCLQGSSEALAWRSWHHVFAKGFIGFVVLHCICAASHLLDFIRN
ncbi:cytochrome b/b6 domain-containing protein [Shewanella sp. Isolate11]|uniref:cytochrome b/b6 domain-containing protein n=1 Tax=Shewanella sp. Isolate11 TaxID=2908530 RepID=UPI001EFD625F|nr:cytochrome b/b6 domain-containing protein [Shewanella sp. Isolate11]MCG9697582.1 cytochrome b/b6 domain-containing protein [Shewanella sp. Isolate11]